MNDEDERDESEAAAARVRSLILARRNRFVAAALAGLGIGAGCTTQTPSACLRAPADPASAQDGGAGNTDAATPGFGNPQDARPPVDEGADEDAGTRDAAPKVCLTIT